jgi:hypothetical protein
VLRAAKRSSSEVEQTLHSEIESLRNSSKTAQISRVWNAMKQLLNAQVWM